MPSKFIHVVADLLLFLRPNIYIYAGFPSGSEVKNSSVMQEAQERQVWSLGQRVRKIP